MGLFDITPEDVARGTLLQPGWYPGVIKQVTDKPATTDGTNVSHVGITILEALDHSGAAVQNVPVLATFSVKAPGSAINFLNALGANIGKEGKKSVDLSDATCKGKKVSVYIKNDIYDGRTLNKCADFKPMG